MQEITLGELLERLRTEKGISKTQLCQGICSSMTLGRYERDERVPDKFVIDCLLERLDKNPEKMEFIASDEEFQLSLYRDETAGALEEENLSKAEEILQKYRNAVKKRDYLHQQYIDMKFGEILIKRERYQEALSCLERALAYTKSVEIIEQGIEEELVSHTELEIIYKIAVVHYILSDYEITDPLFLSIENFLKPLGDYNEKKLHFFPDVLYYRGMAEKAHRNYGAAYSYLCRAEQLMRKGYRYEGLLTIMKSRIALGKETTDAASLCSIKALPQEIPCEENMVLALKMLKISDNEGMLTKEGVALWESTANQQL